ncbi:MAG: outer membrane protein assembly factor BamA [candidate division Zixibacteria bacterium RBG_16_53_22]|nr:MAG: outer membrane protein assembly factor BamA [candidate division Zixibacteria bacterium RBG_16_53_22]
MRNTLILALLILSAPALRAQDIPDQTGAEQSRPWNKPITTINIQGISAADTFLVLNSSGLVPGDILTAGMVQDAIKGVYALGLFSDIKIESAPDRDGVALTIVVTEFPKLRKMTFSGNKKIKKDKLEENMTLFEGRLASSEAIKNNVEKIKSLCAEKGYLLADVEVEQTPVKDEPGLVDLQFQISEGMRVRVSRITFDGNTHFTDKKLRGQMSTKQKALFRTGNFTRDKYLEDRDKIVDFYKNHGYIDAVVLGDSIWYNVDKTRMFIELAVREGNRYYFGKIDWQGNAIFTNDRLQEAVKFEPGKVYNQKKYDETIMKFHELYQDEGYWYCQIDEKSIPSGDTLNFNLNITENKPVHIRLVNIEGNTKTREKVVRRELVVKPGTVFKRSVLGRSIRELMILNFFSNVEPGWDILPNGDIDLKMKVTEKETGQFSVGAGYSQRDKLVATVGLGVPNIFGTGQTATMNVELGGRRNTFDLSYLEPWLFDTPTSLSGSFYLQERLWYDWYTERRTGGDFQVGRRLRWPDNYFRIFAGYRLEAVDYIDIADSTTVNVPRFVYQYNWPLTTSSSSLTILRDSRDLPLFPTKGSVVSWRGELAGTFLGGDWNYFKQSISAEYYKTLFWKFVLMGRARYGEIDGLYHGEKDIPYSERFGPGGVDPDGTVRGYEDGTVGPYKSNQGYLRGRFESIYNLELTVPIAEQQFYVLAFADAGNACLSFNDIKPFKGFYRSAGIGFRIMIPLIGIMGFDFGYPFDGADRHSWKTHFQIGRGF